VASAWTFLMVAMFAASLLDWPSKPIVAAHLNAAPTVSSPPR
jgi:hypothetical protein